MSSTLRGHARYLTPVFVFFALCVASPVNAQDGPALVDRARQAAQADRNAESAELFRQAIEAEPSRRAELLREYADQLTYSNRSREAVPLYREVLERPALAPEERRRAMSGLALALSWSGQHHQAIEVYSQILEEEPEDRDARLGRARALTWQDRYSRAEAEFRAILEANPNDAEAIRGLAEAQSFRGHQLAAIETLDPLTHYSSDPQALYLLARTQNWSGRPDLAADTVQRAAAARPDDPATAQLQREIEIALAPRTELSARHSEQSDDLAITQLSGWQSFIPGGAFATAALGLDYINFDPEIGPGIQVYRPGLGARIRLADWAEVNASAGLTIEDEAADTDHLLTYNIYSTFIPSDRLRFDFGVSRSTLDNIRSMLLDITTRNYSASADIGSDAGLKASFRGMLSEFSDGNERTWGQAELRQRLLWKPNLFTGLRYTNFRFSRILDNGYFNPRDLQAIEATAQLWGRTGRIYYDLRGAIGREDADPGAARTVYSGEGRLTYLLSDRIELEAFLASFSSRLATPGGFSRTTGGVTVRTRW